MQKVSTNKPVAYYGPKPSQIAVQWSRAFAEGCGGKTSNAAPSPGQPFAFWGQPYLWHEFDIARSSADWWYGDKAFFLRGQYYRCGRNELQFDGSWGNDDPRRFNSLRVPIRDWTNAGSHILLCPNSETFMELNGGFSPGQWVKETTEMLRKHTDRPIRLRWKRDAVVRPVELDFKDCWAVVTFTSNCAVQAITNGIPAFCTERCAGLTMGSNDLTTIENPHRPEGRERWAYRLANMQWTLPEISAGALWSTLGCSKN